MKHIKALLCISLLGVFAPTLQAQKIISAAKFFYLTEDGSNIDIIEKVPAHQGWFSFGKDTIIEHGNKVYYRNGMDSVLYYDYSLETGDTFYFKRMFFDKTVEIDTTIVDSTKMLVLQDGNTYKHWYLKYKFNKTITWVEGLGEKSIGWYRYDASFFNSPNLKAICKDGDLIYWDKRTNGFKYHTVTATCDFDSLTRLTSVTELDGKELLLYPNPTTNNLNIKGIKTGKYKVYDNTGQLVLEGRIEDTIPTDGLKTGIYLITVINNTRNYTGRFVKE